MHANNNIAIVALFCGTLLWVLAHAEFLRLATRDAAANQASRGDEGVESAKADDSDQAAAGTVILYTNENARPGTWEAALDAVLGIALPLGTLLAGLVATFVVLGGPADRERRRLADAAAPAVQKALRTKMRIVVGDAELPGRGEDAASPGPARSAASGESPAVAGCRSTLLLHEEEGEKTCSAAGSKRVLEKLSSPRGDSTSSDAENMKSTEVRRWKICSSPPRRKSVRRGRLRRFAP